MKRFKEYLNEKVGTSLSELLFMASNYDMLMIPISTSIFKRIWTDTIRTTVFHTTDVKGLGSIGKLEGKKKSISGFFSMKVDMLQRGIATQGGLHAVLEMDADVILSSKGDISTHVDGTGRRFTSIRGIKRASHDVDLNSVEKDFEKLIKSLIEKYRDYPSGPLKTTHGIIKGWRLGGVPDLELWRDFRNKIDSKSMSLLIKDYVDGMENIIKKHSSTFQDVFRSYAKQRTTDLLWDEQVVNNIKIKKVHVVLRDRDDSIEQDEMDKIIKSKRWISKTWKNPSELQTYTQEVAKKELGK